MRAEPQILPLWELPAGSRVICDLHLDLSGEPPRAFLEWLAGLGSGTPVLVVLGDLFDFWVGPAHAGLATARAVLAGLRDLTGRGTRVGVVHGNRDFLLGRAFERETGAEVLPGGLVGELPGGERALLIHGDELCTKDLGYQRLRRVLRSAPVRLASRALPLPLGMRIARRLRRESTRALALKPAPEKSMQREECEARAGAAGCGVVVCGHAHSYRDEELSGGPRWIVLDAFGGPRSSLCVGQGGTLETGPTPD